MCSFGLLGAAEVAILSKPGSGLRQLGPLQILALVVPFHPCWRSLEEIADAAKRAGYEIEPERLAKVLKYLVTCSFMRFREEKYQQFAAKEATCHEV